MPSKHILKDYGAHEYYHVFSRGVAKQPVFLDRQDHLFFLGLFKRYLSDQPAAHKRHGPYPHFGKRLKLVAYCLMKNHLHLLVYQNDETAMTDFLRAIMTSYSMYFNRKYDRVGPVFQSRYKASRITDPTYLEHITRYIHLNPKNWKAYEYSSLPYFLHNATAEWIHPEAVMAIFSENPREYENFLKDYEGQRQILDELNHELADQP